MPTISRQSQNAVTPGRVTRVTFDFDETCVVGNQRWNVTRLFDRLCPPVTRARGADTPSGSNVTYWPSGCLTLRPLQMQVDTFQEKTLATDPTYQPATVSGVPTARQLNTVPVTVNARFRRPTGTGISIGSGVKTSGTDLFFKSKVEAGGSWDTSSVLAPTTMVSEFATAIAGLKAASLPLLPIARTVVDAPVEAGLCLRFSVPGTGHTHPDTIATLIFGQYALALGGDGRATLWEYAPLLGTTTPNVWRVKAGFSWSRPNLVCGSHTILIYPHPGLRGEKCIAIHSVSTETAQQSAGLLSFLGRSTSSDPPATADFLWKRGYSATPQVDRAGANLTVIAGPIWLLERQDLRCEWQLSRLVYPESGWFDTLPFGLDAPTLGADIAVEGYRRVYVNTSFALSLRTTDGAGWSGTPARRDFVARGTLATTDPYWTPQAFGIEARRAGSRVVFSPGSFTTDGDSFTVRSGMDAQSDSAEVEIDDTLGTYPRLRSRGELPARIQTTFTPNYGPGSGVEQTVVLFRGYAISPTADRKGKTASQAGFLTQGIEPGGVGTRAQRFPGPLWHRYSVPMVGMWHRLSRTTSRNAFSWEQFIQDGADSAQRPWKVTDAMRRLLDIAGFPPEMVNIPDIDIRFGTGIGTRPSDMVVDITTSIAEALLRMSERFLGRFLLFDPNAGAQGGQWILVGAPTDTTARAHFFTDLPAGSGTRLPYHPGAYPPISGAPSAFVDVRHPSYVVAPSYNHLLAFSAADIGLTGGLRVENRVFNTLSYKVPGFTPDPDPNSPHYLLSESLGVLADPSLFISDGNDGGAASTQVLVNYILMRAFIAGCMARRIQPIVAPLVFPYDAGTTRYRPLRFYDPVTLNGQAGWYIRSVSASYNHDHLQMADYELERLEPYNPTGSSAIPITTF